MKLMNIKKKGLDFYLTFQIDEEEKVIKTHENIIIKYGLYKTQGIAEDIYRAILTDVSYDNDLSLAIKYLNKIQSKYDVCEYLKKNKCNEENIKEIIKYLEEKHLLDDKEFAESRFTYMISKHKSPKEIYTYLKEKKVDESIINETLEAYDSEAEYENVLYIFTHSFSTFKKQPLLKSKKVFYEKMKKRGFSTNIIKKCIEENIKILDNISKDDELILIDLRKAYNHYKKKNDGIVLKAKIINNLLSKGYQIELIKKYIDEEVA